jgi:hypothetical protein
MVAFVLKIGKNTVKLVKNGPKFVGNCGKLVTYNWSEKG